MDFRGGSGNRLVRYGLAAGADEERKELFGDGFDSRSAHQRFDMQELKFQHVGKIRFMVDTSARPATPQQVQRFLDRRLIAYCRPWVEKLISLRTHTRFIDGILVGVTLSMCAVAVWFLLRFYSVI